MVIRPSAPVSNTSAPAQAPILYSGPWKPPPQTGTFGDYFLDVPDSALYGPKTAIGWGIPFILSAEPSPGLGGDCEMYTGYDSPPLSLGVIGDFYLDLTHGILYGPKDVSGWTSRPFSTKPIINPQ